MSRMADYCDIACDLCGQWVAGTVESTAEMRKLLKQEKWTLRKAQGGHGRSEDICPVCNKRDKEYWNRLRLRG